MTEAEIEHVIEAFGKAAAFAKQCGFGMVTIHGGHGWLIPQFWSKQINSEGSMGRQLRKPHALSVAVIDSVGRPSAKASLSNSA
jgi:2,4-dienoyl-CoA reductase-like NADH-dependent reductase (Old Yellow Enzyme family)